MVKPSACVYRYVESKLSVRSLAQGHSSDGKHVVQHHPFGLFPCF